MCTIYIWASWRRSEWATLYTAVFNSAQNAQTVNGVKLRLAVTSFNTGVSWMNSGMVQRIFESISLSYHDGLGFRKQLPEEP